MPPPLQQHSSISPPSLAPHGGPAAIYSSITGQSHKETIILQQEFNFDINTL